MKPTILTLLLLFAFTTAQATIRYVDKTGVKGPYTSIQAAINAAIDGDTIRILPGIYTDTVNISKNVVVQGGGALNTTISAQTINSGAAVTMTAGKLMWLGITSSYNGLFIQNATASNCTFYSCTWDGVDCQGSNALLINCISNGNGGSGFSIPSSNQWTMIAINCVATNNKSYGFWMVCNGPALYCRYCDAYGNGGGGYNSYCSGWPQTTNCLSIDPGYGTEWRLSSSSGCVGKGDPTILNLNASPSDMGYYGGPDAPLLPYVTLPATFKLNADGTVTFDMIGKVGY